MHQKSTFSEKAVRDFEIKRSSVHLYVQVRHLDIEMEASVTCENLQGGFCWRMMRGSIPRPLMNQLELRQIRTDEHHEKVRCVQNKSDDKAVSPDSRIFFKDSFRLKV